MATATANAATSERNIECLSIFPRDLTLSENDWTIAVCFGAAENAEINFKILKETKSYYGCICMMVVSAQTYSPYKYLDDSV